MTRYIPNGTRTPIMLRPKKPPYLI